MEKLTSVLIENDFVQNKNDFSLFTKNKNGVFIALLVYVDDIVVSGNNIDEINIVKQFLSSNFVIKDLGKLKYFLGVEVLESNDNLYLTQRKYCLEVLAKFSMLACRPCGTPIETKESIAKPKKVCVDSPLSDINNYQKLMGKLIYLTHTRLDIKYVVHVLSQYMHAPLQSHLKLAFRVLSLVSWKSKNQSMLAKSSVEAEYKEMNTVTYDVIWIQKILSELKIRISLPVPIDCVVKTVKVKSTDNVANIFTKGLSV
ncbi:ribonuclease H-like domain-containing protein [Tanacetum coccineum]